MVNVTYPERRLVHTHDEARALIANAAGGLAVRFVTPPTATVKTVRYELYHSAHPRVPLGAADLYSLPFAPGPVSGQVKRLAELAARQLRSALACDSVCHT